jgi:hypothetical protein
MRTALIMVSKTIFWIWIRLFIFLLAGVPKEFDYSTGQGLKFRTGCQYGQQ